MKAFLSHSSKDKLFVRQVADAVGPLNIEYDEQTFEYVPNAESIRRALARSALFVYFLSSDAAESPYVVDELSQALEARAKGVIRDVIIFSLNNASYKLLPPWMRDINVAFRAPNAKACARLIKARLAELHIQDTPIADFYLGREGDEIRLRQILARAPDQTPRFLHVAGHFGVGRRTFLFRSLKASFPRQFTAMLPINVPAFATLDDLHLELFRLNETYSRMETVQRLTAFQELSISDKVDEICRIIQEMSEHGEIPTFFDDGGLFTEEGDLSPIFAQIYSALPQIGRPLATFVQNRILPARHSAKFPDASHIHLKELSEDAVRHLISLKMKDVGVSFDSKQLDALCSLSDGHPYNINFIVFFVAQYGIESVLADPEDIIRWKANQGLRFLKRRDFTPIQIDIMNVLREYRYCDLAMIATALAAETADVAVPLRDLEDGFCVERRDRLYVLSPPVRNSIRHDRRFRRDASWYKSISRRILDEVAQYQGDDVVSINLVTGAVVPALKEAAEIELVSTFILPSHFVRIARDYYDRREWKRSVDFCREALKRENRLTTEGVIETLRIQGLATTRIDPYDKTVFSAARRLDEIDTRTSKRIAAFLRGFAFRLQKRLDDAEKAFLKAYELQPRHIHTNREIASILCRQGRYPEAEHYARQAHRVAPDNPFILDVLLQVLDGKVRQGVTVSHKEIEGFDGALKEICGDGAYHFYDLRRARKALVAGNHAEAGRIAQEILTVSPTLLEARRLKIEAAFRAGDVVGARREHKTFGGLDHEDVALEAEIIEVEILIEEGDYLGAKELIEKMGAYSRHIADDLAMRLEKIVAFERNKAPRELIEWARARRSR